MNVGDQIHGWKEIGSYVGRTERTARRWEIERQLPVRRTPGRGRSSVYALKSELDRWLLSTPSLEDEIISAIPEPVEAEQLPVPAVSPRAWVTAPKWLTPMIVTSALMAAVILTSVASAGRNREHQFPPATNGRMSEVPGVNDLYGRGMAQFDLRTVAGVSSAQQLFAEATIRDPKFARAWASLGNAYTVLGEYEALNGVDAYARARDAAERALTLDPSLAEPHANLGFLDYFRVGDEKLSENEFRTAIRLNPNSAMAHSWFGTTLTYQGRLAEAIHEFDEALKVEPHSTAILAGRALALGLSGRRDEGVEILEKLHRESPNPMVSHHLSVLAAVEPRKVDLYLRSKVEIDEMENFHGTLAAPFANAKLRLVSTHHDKAAWDAIAQDTRSSGLLKAEAEAASGQNDAAFATLEDLLRKPGPTLGLRVDPMFASMHGDKRWTPLVEQDGRPWSP